MNRIIYFIFFMAFSLLSFGQKKSVNKKNTILLEFENIANGKKIVLNDSVYSNGFGEKYTVSKLKYYVSNLHFVTKRILKPVKNVFLIDAAKENIILLPKIVESVTGIEFLLGVDSILNSSGAQSGELDPLNDMFWTWNSGYVMFKLEGNSDSSNADLHRIEQHIGGYKGAYKTMRKIFIPFDKKYFSQRNGHQEITITLNLDRYWNGVNEIRISEQPLITTIGKAAKEVADNFKGMFSQKIIY